jgi:ketosteroid isomerase-like protein
MSTPAKRWAEGYARAWRTRDPEAALSLYAEDVVDYVSPFRPPSVGRAAVFEYTRRVFGEEEQPEVWFGEPVEEGDRAVVEWWATYVEEGREVTLSGCSLLRFAGDGLVLEARSYWHEEEGRRPPPAGWGR